MIDLLEYYHSVEEMFNGKRYEDTILELRDKYKNDANFEIVVSFARSYFNMSNRTELVLSILDQVRSSADGRQEEASFFLPVVEKFTTLNSASSAKVSLKAREFLLYFQMPRYEERVKETLKVLTSAVRRQAPEAVDSTPVFDYDNVIKLITANHAILDVLPSFFLHENLGIRAIALYTYVLHTSQAYTITSVRHIFSMDPVVFDWEFVLRPVISNSKSGSIVKREFGSFSNLTTLNYDNSPRRGLMCAFKSLDQLREKLSDVIQIGATRSDPTSINILNIAIDMASSPVFSNDASAREYLFDLIQLHADTLTELKYKRVTFMIVKENHFPRYFTFQQHLDFSEDQVIRHIEHVLNLIRRPSMSFQLELQRLQDFEIKPIFVDNRRIHMYLSFKTRYHSIGKKNPSDARFFIRALVYPGQVVSHALQPSEFLVSEGNRILADVLDNLEVVWSKYPNTDCNHLFINFIPTFELDLGSVEQCLKELVDKHGKRLWKLRITQAEVRFIMRHSALQSAKPIRFVMSSSTGYVTRVEIYQEVRDSVGVNRLMSISSPPGQLHKQPVHKKYATKESVQPKRYKAHLMGTTYVYDFPDLFRRSLEKRWTSYQAETMARAPPTLLEYFELVLNKDGELVPTYREHGLNNCGMVVWQMQLHTPEYPEGREMIVIANDVTFSIGSFGTNEDDVFYKATEYARRKGFEIVNR